MSDTQTMRPRILVIGDVNLDVYRIGKADRISPEAPVPVIHSCREEYRPGGAAAVAWIAAGLGADVSLLSRWAFREAEGQELRGMLHKAGVAMQGPCSGETTVKKRIFAESNGHGLHQICRDDVDHITPATEAEKLCETLGSVLKYAGPFDAILIADYGRGVCSPELLAEVFRLAGDVPVLVDPARGRHPMNYAGATLIKMNRSEAAPYDTDALAALTAPFIVKTLDRDGIEMWVKSVAAGHDNEGQWQRSKRDHYSAPSLATSVVDVTGAGDSMLAAMGVYIAKNPLWRDDPQRLLDVAQRAAAAEIAQLGVVQIPPGVLEEPEKQVEAIYRRTTLEHAASFAKGFREQGYRVSLVNGVFDILHGGHLEIICTALRESDAVIMAINSDASVKRLKGESRPAQSQSTRAAVLEAMDGVDAVVIFDEDTPLNVIEAIRPDVLVRGDEPGEIVGQAEVESWGGKVVRVPKVAGFSTTATVERMKR